jgi:hypothetical protein
MSAGVRCYVTGLLFPSFGRTQRLPLGTPQPTNTKALHSFITSETLNSATQHHTPQDLNPQFFSKSVPTLPQVQTLIFSSYFLKHLTCCERLEDSHRRWLLWCDVMKSCSISQEPNHSVFRVVTATGLISNNRFRSNEMWWYVSGPAV